MLSRTLSPTPTLAALSYEGQIIEVVTDCFYSFMLQGSSNAEPPSRSPPASRRCHARRDRCWRRRSPDRRRGRERRRRYSREYRTSPPIPFPSHPTPKYHLHLTLTTPLTTCSRHPGRDPRRRPQRHRQRRSGRTGQGRLGRRTDRRGAVHGCGDERGRRGRSGRLGERRGGFGGGDCGRGWGEGVRGRREREGYGGERGGGGSEEAWAVGVEGTWSGSRRGFSFAIDI